MKVKLINLKLMIDLQFVFLYLCWVSRPSRGKRRPSQRSVMKA